jgi:hypothetical protein
LIGILFQNFINNEWSEPHGCEFSCPQGIFIFFIDQDKIAFEENSRVDGPIILTLDMLFVSLVGQVCISTLLIEFLDIQKMLFKWSSVE